MTEIPFDRTTNHGWWANREDHIDLYHGTHKRNVPHIEKDGVSVPDPKTGMVSMTPDPNTAHGYAAMSSGERRGEHSFRKAGAKAVTTPEEDRAVTKFRIPMSWVHANVDPDLRGNIGIAANRMTNKKEYDTWKKQNPNRSDHEYYAGTELRFSNPIPPEFYMGHSHRTNKNLKESFANKLQSIREEKEDAMISFRKKVDAAKLAPSRSGSKGGDLDENTLEEGNPLARMHGQAEKGTHFIAVSTERPGLTKKDVKERNKKLVSMARERGFGVRKSEGHYEGSKETSHIIHAKAPGNKAGAELVAFGREAGRHFDQDSVLHHTGKTARLIGTNTTGFPGMDKSEKVGGKLKFNNPESPFQTELRPGKKKVPARFTTE